MSIRSNWCEYDKDTRKYIKKRDNNECVICHNKGALQIMHVWVNRSHGGKGSKENGCLGCIRCHKILDNPIGEKQQVESKRIMEMCKNYLIEKENLIINEDFIKSITFNKQEYLRKNTIEAQEIKHRLISRCKTCKYLIKSKYSNSSIPAYYCTKFKKKQNKNKEACESFKNTQWR